jgi:hypothetical protein
MTPFDCIERPTAKKLRRQSGQERMVKIGEPFAGQMDSR